ncbi:carbohydrate ABC transporter permease [Halopelagius longus]|uniref:Carbohydrate ABC transporter membrane protein 2, CUT1 family n=1 Tax=Halopelagius longus TaxID=1236180 RepID=A0A1H1FMB0_9EURY|nr:carbohydrate ABC transporter permease [Halopelagius longus]RDI70037.1 carbohydrate ABC transporter permease [Halopelagius longus]SDR01928.1 carbohydrate ABC transporter membrane protein 2, CUT1 family [Halopelagius longus]
MASKTRDTDELLGFEVSPKVAAWAKTLGFHALLWSSIFVVLMPVLWMIVVSLNQVAFDTFIQNPGAWLEGANLDAYRRMLYETNFIGWFRNSVIVTVGSTVLSIVICTFGAYSIGRLRFKGRKAVATFLLMTQMFPLILVAVPLFLIFRNIGLFNSLLGLTIAYVAFVLPFSIWMLRGFYENLPEALEEAAMIDGSTRVGAVIRVIVPLSSPAIATTAIFAWIFAWNEFVMALILINDDAKTTLPPGLSSWVGQYTLQWDLLMAGALGATLPLFIILFFLQKYIINGLAEGAVKT